MGDKITLKVDERTVRGKKVAGLRNEGLVPAVVYGPGMEPVAIQAEVNAITKVYRTAGKHAPVHMTIGSKKRIAMIKDVETDPVKRRINHISFHAVNQNEPVVAEVPVRLMGEGESEAEKAGLIILQTLDQVEVRALPMDLPEAIEISTVHLKEAGEKVILADAKMEDGVEFVEHDDGHALEEGEEQHHVTELQVASVWEPGALQAANEEPEDDRDESDVDSEHGEGEEDTAEGSEAKSEEKSDD